MTNKHFKHYETSFEDPDQIADCTDELYRDNDNDEPAFPLILDACDISPNGQHEFSIGDPEVCIHCGRRC